MIIKLSPLIIITQLLVSSCNGPPLYPKRAKEFLISQGESTEMIQKLINRKPLNTGESGRISQYNNIAVLHLLASNESTPLPILQRLAKHQSFEVHTGLVSNKSVPFEILITFRTEGKYTTVNDSIARNPSLPPSILLEMYNNGEIGNVSPALNPNCPEEVMWKIYKTGRSVDRAWLSKNPNLPLELFESLNSSKDPLIESHIKNNPNYLEFIKALQ